MIELLEGAIKTHGKPEIHNSDQGSQYTSTEYIEVLKRNEIEISMDGRRRAIDNIYIERFWRSIKYEKIYLNPPNGGVDLRDRKSTRLNSSHVRISYAVFCLKKKKKKK